MSPGDCKMLYNKTPTGSAQLITISFGSCPSMRLVLAPVDALLPAHHDVGITADNYSCGIYMTRTLTF
ncbi:hypothetical protein T01_4278 [Trichinella spiralis]|uniref:Uncharacterized protein n=1 Tax=Trichinella spiralis TaxID=6334 RepID=A0A0V1BZ47_TRISP|nr:hypothetical protein T01_4278 [Trichinella spiralis]